MGRSLNCSRCKQLKEPGRNSDTYCKACRATVKRERNARNRAARGQAPLGQAVRSIFCASCASIKENKDSGYCNKCKREAAAAKRIEAKKDPNFVANERQKKKNIRERSEFERIKILARVWVQRAIKAGKMVRQPCEICGLEKVDAHHDDYWKPYDVRWLCRSHHREHHECNKGLIREDYL